MSLIALKVDVDTLRGTREGVPALVRLFQRYRAGASFLFSLGPDHTGRAIRRVLRPGFIGKVNRTSVTRHYGWKTLLYGTVLPGPDIVRRAADIMCSVRDSGFETAVHTFDHVRWQDFVARRDGAWTRREMDRALNRYRDVFGTAAPGHGAAGWQLNDHVLRYQDQIGLRWASDTRGTEPFVPWVDGRRLSCPQLPTTLPTLDELIGRDGWTEANVANAVLAATRAAPRDLQVYTLHAELEGLRLLPVMEQLLRSWQADGHELVSLGVVRQALDSASLPAYPVAMGTVPGRSGQLAVAAVAAG